MQHTCNQPFFLHSFSAVTIKKFLIWFPPPTWSAAVRPAPAALRMPGLRLSGPGHAACPLRGYKSATRKPQQSRPRTARCQTKRPLERPVGHCQAWPSRPLPERGRPLHSPPPGLAPGPDMLSGSVRTREDPDLGKRGSPTQAGPTGQPAGRPRVGPRETRRASPFASLSSPPLPVPEGLGGPNLDAAGTHAARLQRGKRGH